MSKLRYTFEPAYPDSRLDHVGTYKRTLPVNLDRMYENALDWEHLPHLHASSFSDIECLDAGAWGWRCRSVDKKGQESVLELKLDRSARRWITRNLEGPSKGAEIWTHVFVTDARSMDLVIDFFVPGVPVAAREKVGRAYAAAYEVLYDEDVAMMTGRQRALDMRLDSVDREESVRVEVGGDGASEPVAFSLSGREYKLIASDGAEENGRAWWVYPALCPHQLGPLETVSGSTLKVSCPWHGYAFDVESGECTTGSNCRFGARPQASEVEPGVVEIGWN